MTTNAKCDICEQILDFPNWIAQQGEEGLMYKNPKCLCTKCYDNLTKN